MYALIFHKPDQTILAGCDTRPEVSQGKLTLVYAAELFAADPIEVRAAAQISDGGLTTLPDRGPGGFFGECSEDPRVAWWCHSVVVVAQRQRPGKNISKIGWVCRILFEKINS